MFEQRKETEQERIGDRIAELILAGLDIDKAAKRFLLRCGFTEQQAGEMLR